jgi:ribose transport system substrate-binding protein
MKNRPDLSGSKRLAAALLTTWALTASCRSSNVEDKAAPGPSAATSSAPAPQTGGSGALAPEGCARLKPTGTGLSKNLVGPNGEPGVTAESINVTDADVAAAKAAVAGKVVAVAQHIGTVDYTRQVVAGVEAQLTALGAKVVTSDANFDPGRQVSDVENLLAHKPALLIIFPVDQAASSPAILAANRAKVPVVVVGTALLGGGEYKSLISADDYEGGVIAADELAQALGEEGEIAIVPYKFRLWHVDQRVRGFRDGIKCSRLRVVEDQQTCTNPSDCAPVFADILTAHPGLKGAFGAWDGIALGMNAAAQTAGWKGAITTSDLSLASAQAIKSRSEALKATAGQLTDKQGKVTGQIATLVLAGKEVPKMVFVPDAPVNERNVADVYQRLFGKPLP